MEIIWQVNRHEEMQANPGYDVTSDYVLNDNGHTRIEANLPGQHPFPSQLYQIQCVCCPATE